MKNIFGKIDKTVLIDYIVIVIGSALMGIGIGVFLIDAKVVPGGATGLSMAVYFLTDEKIGVGIITWIINIPLFFYGIKVLGKEFGIRTFWGFTISSFFTDFFRGDFPGFSFVRLQDSPSIQYLYHNDFFFFILIGTLLLGIGLGMIFKARATTGGSDILAAIMNKKWGIKTGNSIILLDFVIIFVAGLIIGIKGIAGDKPLLVLILYALLLVFVSSKIIDYVLDGFDYVRAALIFSDKNKEIADTILLKMNRGATALKARALYRNIDTEIIYTVVKIKEITKLQDIVKEIDPDSFMVLTSVHEVVGHGFRRRI
jgi:uncharacterized membrane-anchored protein YitT (DUF2179 family)